MRGLIGLTTTLAAVVLLRGVTLVGAHDHGDHSVDGVAPTMSPTEVVSRPVLPSPSPTATAMSDADQSYFGYPQHAGWIHAHIAIMTVAWVFVLPPAVALSIARSRVALPVQGAFLALNALGLLTGAIYDASTPDLYPRNVHHLLGWLLTVVVACQAALGLVGLCRGSPKKSERTAIEEERAAFIPFSVQDMAEHHPFHGAAVAAAADHARFSHDSGQGTERASASLRSNSLSPRDERLDRRLGDALESRDMDDDGDVRDDDETTHEKAFLGIPTWRARLPRIASGVVSDRTYRVGESVYDVVNRLILPLAFIGFATGLVAYGGIFRGNDVFNGLAHFVKGGIFVWYGLLTLGRWMGCFADLGWAWNVKPSRALVGRVRARVPSAEFVESLVIFAYGASNVFLEHLAAWGERWTAQDLEHVSISVMFFGGGLCGMLVESRRIRDLLNAPISTTAALSSPATSPDMAMDPPRTYRFSMNPFPAIVIMLLGLMMGAHHQSSTVSTMVHKQWGMLFVAFALARAVTYLTTYLSPPTSILPSRPPSELIASFCLLAGGLIFMASNRDTVKVLEKYHLEAMFIFTVTMGLTAFFMAWTILVVAIKGWAIRRRERGRGRRGQGGGGERGHQISAP